MKIKKGSIAEGILIGGCLAAIMWVVKILEVSLQVDWSMYGLYPRDWRHLYGIFTMPFLHGNWDYNNTGAVVDSNWGHISANTGPLIILIALTSVNYRSILVPVTLIIWLLGGFWTWLLGSDNFHIGASGVVYGFASFLFFAGVFSKNYRMLALSMLVVFLYGSLFWGMFPMLQGVSWEGHLSGAAAGCFAAYAYRNKLPGRKVYEWENEDDEDDDINQEPELPVEPPHITYHFNPSQNPSDQHEK